MSYKPRIYSLFTIFYVFYKILTFKLDYSALITAISDLICKQSYLSKHTTPNSINIKVIASAPSLDIYEILTSDDLQIFPWFYSSCNIILVLLPTSPKHLLLFKST